ncbi:hypothetical protein [Gloeothece verrucosa]|uniref:Low temperature-induced protein n=1 Tax=Gloeothece verrucosa (strain PCC 7822) TaxID=497965 RepID=E0UG74_GLOV7|nr:hypothetical protein [Gloeothece verrucosa]ADN15575.1 hypothetical protein Cyan7822_3637 [Gloeothece verrucosa PCC 7822]
MLLTHLKNSLKNSLKVVITACLSLFLCILIVNPAVATIVNPPDMGEASLNAIQDKTDRAASENPYATQERARTQDRKKGLNLVQEDADKENMYNEGSSKDDRSITQKVENALEKITGADKDKD